jgi:hypothetical protein
MQNIIQLVDLRQASPDKLLILLVFLKIVSDQGLSVIVKNLKKNEKK